MHKLNSVKAEDQSVQLVKVLNCHCRNLLAWVHVFDDVADFAPRGSGATVGRRFVGGPKVDLTPGRLAVFWTFPPRPTRPDIANTILFHTPRRQQQQQSLIFLGSKGVMRKTADAVSQ